VFPEKVHLSTAGEESWLYIPPPGEFPEKVLSVTVGEEFSLYIPPPL